MKRLLIWIALVFALAVSVPAFAAGNGHGLGQGTTIGSIDGSGIGGAATFSAQSDSPIYVF